MYYESLEESTIAPWL